jgi:phosphoribosyl 1,2-cyclic phosphodiesterase
MGAGGRLSLQMTQRTNVCVLASTSAGNCTAIWNESVSILVDCGTGISYTEEALARLGLSLQDLSAIFITHCHSDHVNRSTLKRLIEHKVPIYCNVKAGKVLRKSHPFLSEKNSSFVALSKESGECKGFSYNSFCVPHDSKGGCFGYSFFLRHAAGTHKISIATDIGYVEPGHVGLFADSNIIVIESNHDVAMLKDSPRPQWLKDRILKTGHLSNDQCADFIRDVLAASQTTPSAVILAHISQECNTNAHAKECMRNMISRMYGKNIGVVETFKEKPSMVVSV